MNGYHALLLRVQNGFAGLENRLHRFKHAVLTTSLTSKYGQWGNGIFMVLADSSTAGVQARFMVDEVGQFAARVRDKWKGFLPHWKGRIAHALGMGIMRAYRRACSIQICVKGMENIPPGAKILAANHPNLSDTYLLPLLFDGKIRTLAQASQFRAPILGWILTHSGQIPVYADRRQAAYPIACQALADGDTLLVYPEGRLNPDNIKLNACSGAVRMALSSGAPIIPIGIHVSQGDTLKVSSTSGYANSKKLWQMRGKFNVQIGEAWHVSKDPGNTHTVIQAHSLTKVLMEKIECLRKQALQESES